MVYIKRDIEQTLVKLSKMFPAVLLTGARQVGKTTLLENLLNNFNYVTLDDPFILNQAKENPWGFFKSNQTPLIIDEIQYAPELFPYIKMICDKEKKKGLFFLTGSQQFRMMKNITESLAGRICIVNLCGLSNREIYKSNFNIPFIPSESYLKAREKCLINLEYKDLWKIIHKGSMPAMYVDNIEWQSFYSSYTKTYIERDVKDLAQVGNELKFLKFMTALAARTSQVLNISNIANEIGVSATTCDRWLSVLIASNIVFLLKPYSNNILKRALKTPKIYFLDTGLAAYLTRWMNSEVLETGAMSGAFFETFVIAEILKSYYNNGIIDPLLYYYRDKDKNEIDLLIEENGVLYPVEIKKTSTPQKNHLKNFKFFEKKSPEKIGQGALICNYDKIFWFDDKNKVIPVSYL
ncbi:MAG: ATP-binding protein [Candidatus Muiribacteriota bacterium]